MPIALLSLRISPLRCRRAAIADEPVVVAEADKMAPVARAREMSEGAENLIVGDSGVAWKCE
jgi:hypothetical protein